MTRRYPVRPKTTTMVLAALFFALAGAVLLWLALSSDRGLVINHVFHLDPPEARVFYAILAALSFAFTVTAAVVLLQYRRRVTEVVIDELGITTPGPLWRLDATRTAKFAEVTGLRLQRISGQDFLTVVTPSQKVWIARSHLPEGAFDEIVLLVRDRVAFQDS